MYIKVKLSDKSVVDSPIDLPSFLQGLQQESLYDLSWTDPSLKVSEYGLFPVIYDNAAFDNSKEILENTYSYKISDDNRDVIATQNVRDMNADETSAYNAQIAAQAQSDLTSAITAKITSVGTLLTQVINGGVTFESKSFQLDESSRQNLDSASLLATLAQLNGGGKANDLRWANPNVDFGWIAIDNSILPMDAPTVVNFGKLSAAYYTSLIFTARAMKDSIMALTTVADVEAFDITKGWPSSTIG